jgi:hypothetical protein
MIVHRSRRCLICPHRCQGTLHVPEVAAETYNVGLGLNDPAQQGGVASKVHDVPGTDAHLDPSPFAARYAARYPAARGMFSLE